VLGHIAENGALIDDRVNEAVQDEEEKQANLFALELLTGRQEDLVGSGGVIMKAEELAKEAYQFGKEHRISPGHIILNYAFTHKRFPLGNKALSLLEPGRDAVELVRSTMIRKIDITLIPEDSGDFLLRVTGHEQAS
jgi:hypothetical protein